MKHTKCTGFTLVELIVSITILAILGTIGFISLQSYSSNARDSVRKSDMMNMNKSLEFYRLKNGHYPAPTNGTAITYSGATVWTQGTYGESVIAKTKMISKKPVDPVSAQDYAYSLNGAGTEYQLAAVLENQGNTAGVFNEIFAALENGTAYLNWNYNGIIAKASSGWTDTILAVPSLFASDISNPDLSNIVSNKKLVFNGYTSLPAGVFK